jgi:flavin reductase
MRVDVAPELSTNYLNAMARLATGVSVVTTDGVSGRRGLTVSAVTSVSIDDAGPVLLICVNDRGGSGRAIVANGCFCVNMLDQSQADLAERFAGRPIAGDRFDGLALEPSLIRAPRLSEAYAAFDCSVLEQTTVGMHCVIYGRVLDVTTGPGTGPLIYAGRRFCAAVPTNVAA